MGLQDDGGGFSKPVCLLVMMGTIGTAAERLNCLVLPFKEGAAMRSLHVHLDISRAFVVGERSPTCGVGVPDGFLKEASDEEGGDGDAIRESCRDSGIGDICALTCERGRSLSAACSSVAI